MPTVGRAILRQPRMPTAPIASRATLVGSGTTLIVTVSPTSSSTAEYVPGVSPSDATDALFQVMVPEKDVPRVYDYNSVTFVRATLNLVLAVVASTAVAPPGPKTGRRCATSKL